MLIQKDCYARFGMQSKSISEHTNFVLPCRNKTSINPRSMIKSVITINSCTFTIRKDAIVMNVERFTYLGMKDSHQLGEPSGLQYENNLRNLVIQR